jgi:hypothetical protein
MLTTYQADAQQVLDDLFNENLIPFKLEAHLVTDEGPGRLRIHFSDIRLDSIDVRIRKYTSIKNEVRDAVLSRVPRMPSRQNPILAHTG